LAQPAKVTINLYSCAGKLVSDMIDNSFGAGSHHLSLDKDMSCGKYILRVKANEQAVNQLLFMTK
jgi:hypothetical protein